MPFVKCSVDGCSRKLQPILKVDARDRDTWLYRECDVCLATNSYLTSVLTSAPTATKKTGHKLASEFLSARSLWRLAGKK